MAVVVCTIAVLGVLARLPLINDPRWTPASDRDVRQVLVTLGLYPAGTILVTLVWVLASVAVTATGSVAAYRYLAGQRTPMRVAWGRAKPRLPSAFGLGFLDAVVFLVPIVLAVAGSIALAVRTGPGLARTTTTVLCALAVLFVLSALPALVIAGPMLVIEKLGPIDALCRAFTLQRHGYWRLLGRVICTYLLVSVVSTVAGLPFTLASLAARPGSDVASQSLESLLFGNLGWVVGQIAVLPFLIVTNALLYLDQKERSEAAEAASA